MNEKMIQEMITDLGRTIAQLYIDLAAERAQSRLLSEELENTNKELIKIKMAESEEAKMEAIDNE